jgi:hypothetical protein
MGDFKHLNSVGDLRSDLSYHLRGHCHEKSWYSYGNQSKDKAKPRAANTFTIFLIIPLKAMTHQIFAFFGKGQNFYLYV